MKNKRAYPICRASEFAAGARKIVNVDGKEIGIFNVAGEYFALLNYCPHKGGALCEGPVTGTALPTDEFEYVYGRAGEVLRCGWHGWEFDIRTGKLLFDSKIRATTYPVEVRDGEIVVLI